MAAEQPLPRTLGQALQEVVSRLLTVAQLHRQGNMQIGNEHSNAHYLMLLDFAEDLAAPVDSVRTALSEFRSWLPNVIEYPEVEWDDIDPFARSLQARTSEIFVADQVEVDVRDDWVELLATIDRGIEGMRTMRRKADADFETMLAAAGEFANPPGTAALLPIALSDKEQQEVLSQRFNSTMPIFIEALVAKRGGGVVRVGGQRVTLPRRLFRLFLRLVVGLHESSSGYVDRGTIAGGGLSDEGYYQPQNLDRILVELRAKFEGVISSAGGPVGPLQFIEVAGRQVRLSTHRKCVTYKRSALLERTDDRIKELAARLPEPKA